MTNHIAFGRSYSIKLPIVVLGTLTASLSMSGGSVLAAHLAGGIDRGGLRTPMLNEGYLAYLPNPNVGRFGEEWTGWIDVRHPSLAGSRDVLFGYDRSDRFVTVRSTILTDSGIPGMNGRPPQVGQADRPTDFDYANKAYLLQSGVSVIETDTRGVTSPAVGMAGSFDFPLSHGLGDAQMGLPSEEQNIMTSNNAGAPTIDNYYANSLVSSNALAETFYPSFLAGGNNDGIFMANIVANSNPPSNRGNDAFAHELYHFLGDGRAVHQEIQDDPATPNKNEADPAHSSDTKNIVYPSVTSPNSIRNVGPQLSPTVGGKVQITSEQAERIFAATGAAPYLQKNVDQHAKGDRVDWNFEADHAQITKDGVNFGLENLANGADNHQGIDALFWGRGFTVAPFIPAPDANNGGQDNKELGIFPATPDFPLDKVFRSVDIFSLSTRYSDSDTDSFGNLTLRDGALDYELSFLGANGQTVPGTLIDVFTGGWTDNTAVDNYLGRWLSPIDAVGIFIKAAGLPTHEGTAQIDAVIASDAKVQDFGDAPDSYKTTLALDGPRYDEGFYQRLGVQWDSETDGQPTILANGDDLSIGGGFPKPVDDEDGVIFGESWVDVLFNIARPGENKYQLRAWWDKNENHQFDHPGDLLPGVTFPELYINDLLTLTPGRYTYRYDLGFNPKDYYSRFRLTWDPREDVKPWGEVFSKQDCMLGTTDCISHGEVEDYAPIPEPSSVFGTFLIGALGLMGIRKKRQPVIKK